MSALPLTVVDGKPVVEIIDHRGKVLQYAYAITRDSGGIWQVRLTKLAGKGGPYLVTWTVHGWMCQCKWWQCSTEAKIDGCKHIEAARTLRSLLESMASAGLVAKGG